MEIIEDLQERRAIRDQVAVCATIEHSRKTYVATELSRFRRM